MVTTVTLTAREWRRQLRLWSCGIDFPETCNADAGVFRCRIIGEKHPFQENTVILYTNASECTNFMRLFAKYLVFIYIFKEKSYTAGNLCPKRNIISEIP